MKRLRVKLTLQQAEQVEWALDQMDDLWCTDDGAHGRDGKVYSENELPTLGPHGNRKTSKLLEMSQHDEINADLLYRLESQLQQMSKGSEGHFEGVKGASKAGRNAALRIRNRSAVYKNLRHAGGQG